MSALANLPGSRVVGRTLGLRELNSLKTSMSEAGIGGVSFQYLGGLYVLLTFDNEEMVSKLLSEKDSWSRWFSMLQPWIGQALPFERVALVNVHGVPPHLVSRGVFDLIGKRYGKVVQSSQFLESDGDLSVDRLGILVDSGNKVNGLLKLSWQDKKYKVWVIEDSDQWIPEFLEDEEESSVASSEFGDASEPPAVGDGFEKEDEEVLASPVEETEEPSGNREGTLDVDVHVPMQNGSMGGDVDSEMRGDQLHGEQEQINIDLNFLNKGVGQVGGGAQVDSGSFNIGKPNPFKPIKKIRRSSLMSRPSQVSGEKAHASEEKRPRKRPRSVAEGIDQSGNTVNNGSSGGDNSIRGFDQFFLDLNNLATVEASTEAAPAASLGGDPCLDSGEDEGGGLEGIGADEGSGVEKEVLETIKEIY
ncbi:hypothetical protein HanXRQr2_Chr10g0429231 [Helianthus annuus]|uniref:DUF4283 domain-containing protein n=1 Tax=Helianthus annuus TaxID=4232 RepID=A0A9K3HW03_HELAN|nr:hypothetical protein HanXRQr2_Chr10g0429231 [Helianthus annuus]KAJ0513032.1 hypothetical protein HanHA300_Chr10g0352881 [Helianthus annuus]KAJ0529152.1 hypothetical protein HanHA89_Chr10g0374531 [Helianthus annuus]KAJ0696035.1 hypothetical protein HanLR1_Chr10g0352381 [Helianthus annuus]